MSDTNNHHSSSKSGSDAYKIHGSFLADTPEHALITSYGLLIPSTDPSRVGKWTDPEKFNFCRDIEGHLVGLDSQPMVRVFRMPKGQVSSLVVIDGVEWRQSLWPVIPTAPSDIDSLVFKSSSGAGYQVPSRPVSIRRTKQNGSWYRIRIADLQEVGLITMQGGLKTWHIRVQLFENIPDRSVTASVLTRKVD